MATHGKKIDGSKRVIDGIIGEVMGRGAGRGFPVPPELKVPRKDALADEDRPSDIEPFKMLTVTEEKEHKGSFIALKIPPEIAKLIAIEGGEAPEKLHITLFYKKGLTPEQNADLLRVVEGMQGYLPQPATLGGIGRFSASSTSDGKDVIYASVDSAYIQSLRDELMKRLREMGIEPDLTHGFTAHITLKYVSSDEPTPVRRVKKPLKFSVTEFECKLDGKDALMKKSSNKIPHLDDLNTEAFERFTKALGKNQLEITEKVDGACFLEFYLRESVYHVRTKNSPVYSSPDQWPKTKKFEAARAAHEALATGATSYFAGNSRVLTADILFGPRPNTLRYEGPNRIVVHGSSANSKFRLVKEGWTAECVVPLRRSFKPTQEALRSPMSLKSWFLKELAEEPSRHGGEMIEGWVFRNRLTNEMVKVVDKELFTGLNKFFWNVREQIERQLMREFKSTLARDVAGCPTLLSPSIGKKMEGKSFSNFVSELKMFQAEDFKDRALMAVESSGRKLNIIKLEWDKSKSKKLVYEAKGRKFEMDGIVRARTDEAIREAASKLLMFRKLVREAPAIESQKLILRMVLGENRWKKLSEGPADSIGVTIGRFQPFHKGHGEIIRKLAKKYSKVIVLVAGNKRSAENPFSYDLRVEMMRRSLPDVESKLEIYPAEADGKPSGYIPGILSNLIQNKKSALKAGTGVTVLVGEDRFEDFKQQIERSVANKEQGGEQPFFDPGLIDLQKLSDVKNDDDVGRISGTQARAALMSDKKEDFKKLVDIHLTSNPEQFEEIYTKLRTEFKEFGSVKESKKVVKEKLTDIGGMQGVMDVLSANAELLKKLKSINIDDLKMLGHGDMGVAFSTAQGNVLKITSDHAEAISSNVLKEKGKALKHVAHIHDVFRFKGSKDAPVWGILQEKLEELPEHDKDEFDIFVTWYIRKDRDVSEAVYSGTFEDVCEAMHDYIWNVYRGKAEDKLDTNPARTPDWMHGTKDSMAAKKPLTTSKQKNVQAGVDKEYEEVLALMKKYQLDKIITDLRHVGIKFQDFHSGNMMKRGSDYVIADIGVSKVAGGQEPSMLEKIIKSSIKEMLLKEAIDSGLEAVGGIKAIDNVLKANSPVLHSKKNINTTTLKRLGTGMMGIAYAHGSQVLKITTDEHEAKASMVLKDKGAKLKHVVKVFDVFRFVNTPGIEKKQIYGILQEKLEQLPSDEEAELKEFCKEYIPREDRKVLMAFHQGIYGGIVSAIRDLIVRKNSGETKDDGVPNLAKTGAQDFEKTGRAGAPSTMKPTNISSDEVDEKEFRKAIETLKKFQIDQMVKDLRSVGIKFFDYHEGNIMKRGSDYVIIDIGISDIVGAAPVPPDLAEQKLLDTMVDTVIETLGLGSAIFTVTGGVDGGKSAWGNGMMSKTTKKDVDKPMTPVQYRDKALQPVDGKDQLNKKKVRGK